MKKSSTWTAMGTTVERPNELSTWTAMGVTVARPNERKTNGNRKQKKMKGMSGVMDTKDLTKESI